MKSGIGRIRVELDELTLARLLDSGALRVDEFRCLDCDSKKCVWRLCLNSCAKNICREGETVACCSGKRLAARVVVPVEEIARQS